jgi:hypothetical protein
MYRLDSAGEITSARETLELMVLDEASLAFSEYLMDVEREAMAESKTTQSLQASGNNSFTLGSVMQSWRKVTHQIVRAVGRSMGISIPARIDLGDPDPLALLPVDARTTFLVELNERLNRYDLPAKTYEQAREVLTSASMEKMNKRAVQRLLSDALAPSVQGPRLERIVRTESTAAFNFDTLQRLAEEGWTSKRWIARHDKDTRDSHAAADGQEQPLSQSFIVGGDLLMVPGDPNGSPAQTYNCRCVVMGAARDKG